LTDKNSVFTKLSLNQEPQFTNDNTIKPMIDSYEQNINEGKPINQENYEKIKQRLEAIKARIAEIDARLRQV